MSLSATSGVSSATLMTSVPSAIAQISNSDDALTLLQAVHTASGNQLLKVLKRDIESATQYLDQLNSITDVIKSFISRTNGNYSAVTVDSLRFTNKDASSLRALFARDGPTLGSTLAEGNAEVDNLNGIGVAIDAPVNTPVLVEVYAGNNNAANTTTPPVRTKFSWYSESDLKKIEDSTTASAGDYVGSEVRTVLIKDSSGKVVETQRYTIFSDYSLRRPDQAAVASAIAKLQERFDSVISTISSIVLEVVNGKTKLEAQIKTQKDERDDVLISRNQEEKSANEAIIEFLRIIRQYRQERDQQKIQSEKPDPNMKSRQNVFVKDEMQKNIDIPNSSSSNSNELPVAESPTINSKD